MSAPVLKYPGSKWRMADLIAARFPPHDVYLEPFFGSGAVFFTKEASKLETLNDLDGRVVNLFQVIRDHPAALEMALRFTPWSRQEYEASYGPPSGDAIEDARRFVVRCWQAFGARTGGRTGWRNDARVASALPTRVWTQLPERVAVLAARLQGVQIECRPALEVIARHDHASVLIYADPPYVTATRTSNIYAHEMQDAEHGVLLDALDRHPGPVLLSGYDCDIYNLRLAHWSRVEVKAQAEKGLARTEVLWINPAAATVARQSALPLGGAA